MPFDHDAMPEAEQPEAPGQALPAQATQTEQPEQPEAGRNSRPRRLIGGRYRLGDELGRGGFGVVYAATDELMRREVAVKEIRLPPSISADEHAVLRTRVLREARSAGRLHHPGLVSVFDVLDSDDCPWIVMELVDGPSLADIIRSSGPLPRERVARIGISLGYALEAAHRSGIVHRDVKPANVLISADGRARLTDFGIALSAGDPTLTRTGVLLGSPSYIAPERARGGVGGPGSDIWALGATLFTAVEGGPPYESDSAIATLTAIVDGRRQPFRLAGALAPIIDDLMAPMPSARPSLPRARRRLREVAERESAQHPVGIRALDPDREHAGQASTHPSAAPATAPTAAPATITSIPIGAGTAAATPGTAGTAGTAGSTLPPATPGSVPAADSRPGTNQRRRLVAVAVTALIMGVAAASVAVLGSGMDGSTGNRAEPAAASSRTAASPSGTTGPSGTARTSAPGSADGTSPTGAAATDDPGLPPTDPTPVAPPAGWQSYRGPSGWSVAYPQGWEAHPAGGTERIDFRNPDTGSYLRIDTSMQANPSALVDWQTHEPGLRAQVLNYERLRIVPSDGGDGSIQADWEFIYTSGGKKVRVLNRGVVRNGHGYALYWSTSDATWSADLPLMWRLFSTFRPGP
ncbi:serine/threonine-protein kinase [Frankia sp. Cr2]|uniref:serine/threonine-protein kinase n=1 Tax=Frankia sp. Cr2 TaxID=3073932 RepID=UPI002AD56682|nr:serine/threonine-protein kinase [Frankia sp. Cr2]